MSKMNRQNLFARIQKANPDWKGTRAIVKVMNGLVTYTIIKNGKEHEGSFDL